MSSLAVLKEVKNPFNLWFECLNPFARLKIMAELSNNNVWAENSEEFKSQPESSKESGT